MKKLLALISIAVLFFACTGQGQPKNDYEIAATPVTGITKYHFFLEKKPTTGGYELTQGMDYLSPNVIALKKGESANPVFTVNLLNDGSEYRVGVVLENAAGFYGGMGVATGSVGLVPITAAGVVFRKKN